MTISREHVLDVVHFVGLAMMAVSILCGRLTLTKLAPSGASWGSIELANCLLIAALATAAGLWFSGSLKLTFEIGPLMTAAALLFFLVALAGIDVLAHRPLDHSLLEETDRVLITVLGLCLLLNDQGRIRQFMIVIVAVGLTITFGDFVGWRLQRLQIITGLSTSRIDLLVLGVALTLYLMTRRYVWLAAAALAIFTLMSDSMKISMIAASAAMFILVIGLLSVTRFADTTKIVAAVVLGVALSIVSGDIHNTLSRVEDLSLIHI